MAETTDAKETTEAGADVQASQLNPEYERGLDLMRQGLLDEAIEAFTEAVRQLPRDHYAYNKLAFLQICTALRSCWVILVLCAACYSAGPAIQSYLISCCAYAKAVCIAKIRKLVNVC